MGRGNEVWAFTPYLIYKPQTNFYAVIWGKKERRGKEIKNKK
jgi:hypothetical protein